MDTSATFFDSFEGSPFQTTQIFNEIRYYPKLKEGRNQRSFFVGPHIGYGMFTLKIPKFITAIVDTELKEEGSYQSGRNAYYGITIGKKIPLKNKKFNLELFLGGGTSQSNYKYYNKEGNRIYGNPDIEKDFNHVYRFNKNIRNVFDLEKAFNNLSKNLESLTLSPKDKRVLFQTYEKVFQHKKFTGRSGTMFSYEGIGSIYWHMISKLLLCQQILFMKI